MRKPMIIIAAAAVLTLPAALAPSPAAASCDGRKNTGMVLGGIGGALLGNAVTGSDGGAVVGGLAGGVLGHQVAKSGCNDRRVVYRSSSRRGASTAVAARAQAPRKVYYDQYGNPLTPIGPSPYLQGQTLVATR